MDHALRPAEHHHHITILMGLALIVGGFFITFVIYTFIQGFYMTKQQTLSVPVYNPPSFVMIGNIEAQLDGGRGYVIHGTVQNGSELGMVAFYPDTRRVPMEGKVQVRGKYIDNTCAYKQYFPDKCVPYVEITQITALSK